MATSSGLVRKLSTLLAYGALATAIDVEEAREQRKEKLSPNLMATLQ